MSGDVPLIDVETVRSLAELRRESNAPVAVGSMVVGDPTGYGRILQRDGVVRRIVEEKDAIRRRAREPAGERRPVRVRSRLAARSHRADQAVGDHG